MATNSAPWYTPPPLIPGTGGDGTVSDASVTRPKLAPDVAQALDSSVKIGGAIGGNPLSPTALGLENQAQLDARIAAQAALQLQGVVPISDVGVPLGVAPLGVDNKVPSAYLPTSYSGGDVSGGSPLTAGPGLVDGGTP